jgi:hypothetical protein
MKQILASVLCITFLSCGYADYPRITPDGYNANLNESKVELRCLLPSGTKTVLWFIDTISVFEIDGQYLREERGISLSTGRGVDGNSTYVSLFIKPIAENDNTKIKCEAYTSNGSLESPEVVFRVQG